ncbi:MAG: hypothetical protein ACR2QJ_11765, partial [Geminicoccaceae bacterium]
DQERQTVQDLEHAKAALGDAETMVERLSGERRAVEALIQDGDEDRRRAAEAETDARSALEAAETIFRERLAAKADIEARCRQIDAGSAALAQQQQALVTAGRELDGRLQGLAEAPQAPFVGAAEGAEALADDANADVMEQALAAAMTASETADRRLQLADEARASSETLLAAARQKLRTAEDTLRARESELRDADHARRSLVERAGDLDDRIERLEQRRAELALKAETRAGERDGLSLDDAENRLSELAGITEGIGGKLAAAIETRDVAKLEAETAESGLLAADTHLGKLDAEALALSELEERATSAPPLLDQVEVEDGYTDALGAALGEDLLGSEDKSAPTFWVTALGSLLLQGPKLPDGVSALADKVGGTTALARRLAQVGLVEDDEGDNLQATLQPGQRLVSKNGALWRWDGLVRKPDGAKAAAARLKQQARRRELESELEAARAEQNRAKSNAETMKQALATANEAIEMHETERETTRLTAEAARHALAELRAKKAAIEAELGPLGEEAARLDAEISELKSEATSLHEQQTSMSDEKGGDEALGTLRAAVEAAASAQQQAEQADKDAALEQTTARAETADCRKRVLDGQERLERCRAEERRQAALVQERAVERAQIEAQLARLETDRAELDRRLDEETGLRDETRAALDVATAELEEAENLLERARLRHGEAKAEDTALRDRHASASRQAETLAADLTGWSERIEVATTREQELLARRKQLIADLADLEALPADLVRQRSELGEKLQAATMKRQELADAVARTEQALQAAEQSLQRVENEQVEARESGAKLEAHLERAEAEAEAAETAVHARLGEEIETGVGEAPSRDALAELETRLARIEASRERLGAVNLRAIDEAAELEMRIQTLTEEKDELEQAIERLRRAISTLNREGRERLRQAFGEVEKHFEALFVRLFGGGRAKIELTDMEDPLNAGLELSASPPGKKLQSLSLLSGGEKALTAIALLFAIFLTRPSPLCLLDEVDAPLDDANVNRLGVLLEELTQATQTRFVVVTHHPMTMARMDRL